MDMRAAIKIVETPSRNRVDRFFAESTALNEAVLHEGKLGDRINAVTQKVTNQYGDIQYAFLAKATMKAMDAYGRGSSANPQVAAALARVAKIAKFAIQNRALLSVLLAILSTLIGIAAHPSPAGANEANQLDMLLQGKGLDEIINKLHQSGIDIAQPTATTGVSAAAEKAAKALVAIERYKFVSGGHLSSTRDLEEHVTMVGSVTKTGSNLHETTTLTTNDGKIVLAKISNSYSVENGQLVDDPSETGVEFQLGQYVRGKTPEQTTAAQDYLERALNREHSLERQAAGMQEGVSNILQRIKKSITSKAPDLGRLIASAVASKPDGQYRVSIGPSGVKVQSLG